MIRGIRRTAAAVRSAFVRVVIWLRIREQPRQKAKQSTPRQSRRYRDPEGDPGHAWSGADWSLTELLNELDYTFEMLEKRDLNALGVSADVRQAIRKIGPLIINPYSWRSPKVDFPDVFGLPAIAAAMYSSRAAEYDAESLRTEDGWFHGRFSYCVRINRFPGHVQRVPGQPYACGGTIVDPKSGRLIWIPVYAGIDPEDGTVRLALQASTYVDRMAVRQKRRTQTVSIPRTTWTVLPNVAPGSDDDRADLWERMVANTLNYWIVREFHWSILVRSKRNRATFVIPQNEAPRFFRDRDATVTSPSGRRARIFHAVAAHYRRTKKGAVPVRMHYRGTRQFTWNGYDVTIFDPRRATFTSLTVDAHDAAEVKPDWIPLGKAADKAASIVEDQGG